MPNMSMRSAQGTKEIIENAIAPLRDEISLLPSQEAISKMLSEALSRMEAKISETIAIRDEKIKALEERVDLLERKLEQNIERKIDDGEQYSRRVCLRLDNIDPSPHGESENECIQKVGKVLDEMDCGLDVSVIDRAHRVGRKFTDMQGLTRQQMIVKFKTFKDRTIMYRNRKKISSGVKVRLDLTKRRFGLLKKVKDFAKLEHRIDFAFADINCAVAIKLKNGTFIFPNSLDNLKTMLSEHYDSSISVS